MNAPPVSLETLAQLDLGFARAASGRTELVSRRTQYPWSLTQPFHDEAGTATVIPQSASGGLYAGERVRQRIVVGESAAVHVASQGATVVHARRDGPAPESHWRLEAGEGARLAVLNDPVVLSPGAALDQVWDIVAAPGARVLLIESWTWHPDPAVPAFERFCNTLNLWRPYSRLLARERSEATAAAVERLRVATMSPPSAFATAVVAGPGGEALTEALNKAVASVPDAWSGVSSLPNAAGIVVRAACGNAGALRPWAEAVRRVVNGADCGN